MDAKYRLFQCIHEMTKHDSVKIKFRFMSYTGLFINIIIENINEYNVYASYTIRCKPRNYNKKFIENEVCECVCTICNLPTTKFDTNVLPEMESLFILQN